MSHATAERGPEATADLSAGTPVSPATEVSSERKAELTRWLNAKRALVFSSDVDGAYGDLYKAHRKRPETGTDPADRPRILKLRLKDSTDEAYHRRELQEILRDGGTLVLDLRGADPKLIKEWNSLYDFDAAGKGVQSVSKDLKIVALADTAAEAPPESVTSRSAKFFDQSKDTKPDPLKALQGEVTESPTTKVNLHQDADPKTWRYELLGSRRSRRNIFSILVLCLQCNVGKASGCFGQPEHQGLCKHSWGLLGTKNPEIRLIKARRLPKKTRLSLKLERSLRLKLPLAAPGHPHQQIPTT